MECKNQIIILKKLKIESANYFPKLHLLGVESDSSPSHLVEQSFVN